MKTTRIALAISAAAALLLFVAGPGTRLGLWEYGLGLTFMRWAFFIGLAGAALALVLLLVPKTRRAGPAVLLAALAIGLAAAWVPWSGYRTARSLPLIHDVTTDTNNPPAFVAIVPLRAAAPNPAGYPGAETAALQREGYPDIEALELEKPAGETFDAALTVARDLGWEIVAAVPDEGRIEATATTFWFGFEDDVVIRVADAGTGSRVDIRSKSRVGRSDVGANAARIRDFLERLAAKRT